MEPKQDRRPMASGRAVRSPREISRREAVPHDADARHVPSEEKRERWDRGIVRTIGGVDPIFLSLVVLLVCLGSVMVFSASYPYALSRYGDSFYFIRKQIVFAVAGLVLMLLASAIPYRLYGKLALGIYGVACVLLVLTLLVGFSEGEAKRWLGVPGTSLSFQPSEAMKAALVFALAWYIDRFRDVVVERGRDHRFLRYLFGVFIPVALIGLACVLVLLEKHLSGTVIIGLIGVSVLMVGGCRFWATSLTMAVPAVGGGTAYLLLVPYARKRFLDFLNNSGSDAVTDDRWQTVHGLWAISSGGLLGLGIGQSRLKYQWVSMAHNDFIFTIWCEETGFVGAVALIVLFALLIWRGYTIALRAPDTFGCLTAFGLTTHVAIQVLLNLAVVTDLIPNTGISLPFFSYGGSSLLILLAEMGVILSISRHSYQKR